MFALILSAVLAATVLTPDTILDRVPGTATLKEMVDAVDNDVDARKQDNLPYPTNAIPASVIVDAPWLLTTEAATNYADSVAENQNVYLRSKADLTVYLGHFGDWTLTRWNETKDMPPEEFRDMRLYSLSNVVEVMTDEYGAVTNTGSFEVYYNGGLVCTGTNGPVANATMFHPVITFTLPPPEDKRTVSTFVAARLSEVSPTDDRLAKLSDIEGGVSGLIETQALHTATLEDHAARIAGMETGKRDLTNNVCMASSFTDWTYEPEPLADYQKVVWMNRSQGYGWYLNGPEEVLITNEENVATLVYEAYGTDFTATRTAICRSNELFVTQSAVKDAADEARVAASNYTDRVASDKADKLLAWTFTGLASRGWVDAKLSFAATPSLKASPLTGTTPLKASAPTVGVWTLLTKTSIDSKWVEVGSYQGAEDVTFIERFEGAETVSASRETVLYTKAISADNPAFSNAVEKIVEKDGPTEFEIWTNGVAFAAGRNAQADSPNDWTRTIALGSESSARADGVTVGGESVAGEKGVSVGLRAGKGYSNRTPGSEAVSLGYESSATNKAVALGTGTLATNEESVVIGADAVSHGDGSVTFGKSGTTLNDVFVGDVRLGRTLEDDYLPRDYTNGLSVALGNNTIVSTNGSTAIGQGSYAPGEYATSVGGSDANGPADLTVGLNNQTFLSSFNHLFGHENISYGYGNGAFGLQNFLYGNWIWALGEVNTVSNAQFSAAIGINNTNTSSDSFIYGLNNVLDDALSSVVIGEGNTASNGILTVVGQDNVVDGRNGVSIAIGNSNDMTGGIDSMSFGSNNKNDGQDTITIGHGARALDTWAIAIGNSVYATNMSSIVIGNYSHPHYPHSHGNRTINFGNDTFEAKDLYIGSNSLKKVIATDTSDIRENADRSMTYAQGIYQYMIGNTNCWFEGTNYFTTAEGREKKVFYSWEDWELPEYVPPSLQLFELREGERLKVWDQRDWTVYYWNFKSAQLTNELHTAFDDTLTNYMVRGWSKYTAYNGVTNPASDTTWIDTAKTVFSAGMQWQKAVEVGGSAYWILESNGMALDSDGTGEGAYLKLTDFEGNAVLYIRKGSRKQVCPRPNSQGYDGDGRVTFTYNINVQPTARLSTVLDLKTFVKESDPSCPANVEWTKDDDTHYTVHYKLKDGIAAKACFLYAEIEGGATGEDLIEHDMPVKLDGGIVFEQDGETYKIKPKIVSGAVVWEVVP